MESLLSSTIAVEAFTAGKAEGVDPTTIALSPPPRGQPKEEKESDHAQTVDDPVHTVTETHDVSSSFPSPACPPLLVPLPPFSSTLESAPSPFVSLATPLSPSFSVGNDMDREQTSKEVLEECKEVDSSPSLPLPVLHVADGEEKRSEEGEERVQDASSTEILSPIESEGLSSEWEQARETPSLNASFPFFTPQAAMEAQVQKEEALHETQETQVEPSPPPSLFSSLTPPLVGSLPSLCCVPMASPPLDNPSWNGPSTLKVVPPCVSSSLPDTTVVPPTMEKDWARLASVSASLSTSSERDTGEEEESEYSTMTSSDGWSPVRSNSPTFPETPAALQRRRAIELDLENIKKVLASLLDKDTEKRPPAHAPVGKGTTMKEKVKEELSWMHASEGGPTSLMPPPSMIHAATSNTRGTSLEGLVPSHDNDEKKVLAGIPPQSSCGSRKTRREVSKEETDEREEGKAAHQERDASRLSPPTIRNRTTRAHEPSKKYKKEEEHDKETANEEESSSPTTKRNTKRNHTKQNRRSGKRSTFKKKGKEEESESSAGEHMPDDEDGKKVEEQENVETIKKEKATGRRVSLSPKVSPAVRVVEDHKREAGGGGATQRGKDVIPFPFSLSSASTLGVEGGRRGNRIHKEQEGQSDDTEAALHGHAASPPRAGNHIRMGTPQRSSMVEEKDLARRENGVPSAKRVFFSTRTKKPPSFQASGREKDDHRAKEEEEGHDLSSATGKKGAAGVTKNLPKSVSSSTRRRPTSGKEETSGSDAFFSAAPSPSLQEASMTRVGHKRCRKQDGEDSHDETVFPRSDHFATRHSLTARRVVEGEKSTPPQSASPLSNEEMEQEDSAHREARRRKGERRRPKPGFSSSSSTTSQEGQEECTRPSSVAKTTEGDPSYACGREEKKIVIEHQDEIGTKTKEKWENGTGPQESSAVEEGTATKEDEESEEQEEEEEEKENVEKLTAFTVATTNEIVKKKRRKKIMCPILGRGKRRSTGRSQTAKKSPFSTSHPVVVSEILPVGVPQEKLPSPVVEEETEPSGSSPHASVPKDGTSGRRGRRRSVTGKEVGTDSTTQDKTGASATASPFHPTSATHQTPGPASSPSSLLLTMDSSSPASAELWYALISQALPLYSRKLRRARRKPLPSSLAAITTAISSSSCGSSSTSIPVDEDHPIFERHRDLRETHPELFPSSPYATEEEIVNSVIDWKDSPPLLYANLLWKYAPKETLSLILQRYPAS